MKRHGKLNSLPPRSLALFKSTGVSLLVAVNHQEERARAVLGCLLQREKGMMTQGHISLWRIIPLQEGTTSGCMSRRYNLMPMMKR